MREFEPLISTDTVYLALIPPAAKHDPMPLADLKRPLFVVLGLVSLGAGVVGIFLPVVPTVPFVLLSAFLFSRSSPRLYALIMQNRVFGPIVDDWNRNRRVPLRVKVLATVTCLGSLVVTFVLVPSTLVRVLVALVIGTVLAVLWRIPHR